jgi:hypothetical protein
MLFYDIKFFKYFFFKTETTLPFQLIKDFCKRSLICNYDEFQKFKIQIYKGREKKNSTGHR